MTLLARIVCLTVSRQLDWRQFSGSDQVCASVVDALQNSGKYFAVFHAYRDMVYALASVQAVDTDLSTELTFQQLLNVVAVNAQGIGTSALEHYETSLASMLPTPEIEQFYDTLDQLEQAMEEVSGDFRRAEGSGLYQLHSKLNHHCQPNAEIHFVNNSARVTVLAKTDIMAGDEVCIAYIEACGHDDEQASLECIAEVHDSLQQFYGFECDCLNMKHQDVDMCGQ